jgi:hypothetical protein
MHDVSLRERRKRDDRSRLTEVEDQSENGLAAIEEIIARQSGCSSLSRNKGRYMAKGRSH